MASRKVAIIVESVDNVPMGLWEKIKNANTLRDLKSCRQSTTSVITYLCRAFFGVNGHRILFEMFLVSLV